jgi:protocatechuate 3,4-dioxygenase beta subunit
MASRPAIANLATACLAVVVSSALLGCSAAHYANGGQDNGSGGSSDLGAGAPAPGLPQGCANVTVMEVDTPPRSFSLRATAMIIDSARASGRPQSWTMTFTDASGAGYTQTLTSKDPSGLTVTFDQATPLTPGDYLFSVNWPQCPASFDFLVGNPTSTAQYRFRVSPPASKMDLAPQEFLIPLSGATNRTNNLEFMPYPITIHVKGPGQLPIAGEVRLIAAPGQGSDAVAWTDGSSSDVSIYVNQYTSYQPLVIPALSSLAPRRFAGDYANLLNGRTLTVDAGVLVSGTIVDAGGFGIQGAKVLLRAAALVSSVGVAAAGSGAFTLNAQPLADPETYTLDVGADGWPEVTCGNLHVQAPVAVDVRYLIERFAVGGVVLDLDGKPVADARVTIRGSALGAVANVTVGSNTVMAGGRVSMSVKTGADGSLPPLLLPGGAYALWIEPPPWVAVDGGTAARAAGLTATSRIVTGAATWSLQLERRITLAGLVQDAKGAPVPNVVVTALESAGLGAAETASTDVSGQFMLTIDPGAPVQLMVEPPASSPLAGIQLSLPAGTTHAEVTLAPGFTVSGFVQDPQGNPVGFALIEAFCDGCGLTTPVASTLSLPSGRYVVHLPNPASSVVDGGTD